MSIMNPQLKGDTGYTDVPEDRIAIDASTMAIGDIVTGHSNSDNENAADIALLRDSLAAGSAKELTLPPPQFVSFFTRINVVCTSASAGAVDRVRAPVSGGSRADVVRFRYTCESTIYGCDKMFTIPTARRTHELTCTVVSYEAGQEYQRKQALYTLTCSAPGCTSTFLNAKYRYDHIRRFHGKGV